MDLKNKLFNLIDSGASQAKNLIESFNDVVDSFDLDAHIDYFNEKKKELIKRGNELFGDFSELLKEVKENLTDFSISVPFNESIGEKLSYEFVDGELVVEVNYKDNNITRNNKTYVTLPENCDLNNVSVETNNTTKTATIIIPKVINECVNENEVPKKKARKKKKVRPAAPENSGEQNKLEERLSQNGKIYENLIRRGTNGRFVRKTPKNPESENL